MKKGSHYPAEVLTLEEFNCLLSKCPPTKTGSRNRALLCVYMYAQLRCNEALNLRPCDIDWITGSITVMCGKGKKRRVVGIPASKLRDEVDRWRIERPNSPWFFCSHKGTRLCGDYVRRMIKRYAAAAGIDKRVYTHGLRHTGAFFLANKGMDLRLISRQLGHTSLATTERYINHLSPTATIEAVNALTW